MAGVLSNNIAYGSGSIEGDRAVVGDHIAEVDIGIGAICDGPAVPLGGVAPVAVAVGRPGAINSVNGTGGAEKESEKRK